MNSGSSSVGSLPGPRADGSRADSLGSSEAVLGSASAERELGWASRELAGRWREAMFAERALGWVLWTILALVIVTVSR